MPSCECLLEVVVVVVVEQRRQVRSAFAELPLAAAVELGTGSGVGAARTTSTSNGSYGTSERKSMSGSNPLSSPASSMCMCPPFVISRSVTSSPVRCPRVINPAAITTLESPPCRDESRGLAQEPGTDTIAMGGVDGDGVQRGGDVRGVGVRVPSRRFDRVRVVSPPADVGRGRRRDDPQRHPAPLGDATGHGQHDVVLGGRRCGREPRVPEPQTVGDDRDHVDAIVARPRRPRGPLREAPTG